MIKDVLVNLKEMIEQNIAKYERSEPVIYNFLDELYINIDEQPATITISHLLLANDILEYDNNNWNTNQIYKLYETLGQSTTGLAGF